MLDNRKRFRQTFYIWSMGWTVFLFFLALSVFVVPLYASAAVWGAFQVATYFAVIRPWRRELEE